MLQPRVLCLFEALFGQLSIIDYRWHGSPSGINLIGNRDVYTENGNWGDT